MIGLERFRGYSLQSLRKDLLAGVIVAIVAIPLAMSFAIASGVKPQYGIYSTIVAGFLISLLGGSRFQIGGPTGAFIPILLGIVLQYGYENLLLAGMMAGVLLMLMGFLRLGVLIQFIPKPVTVGFTTGIAVTIFSGQIGNFLGLTGLKRHENFLPSMKELADHLGGVNPYAVATAAIGLAVIVLLPKLYPRVPSSLVGLVVATAVAALAFSGKVATIGSTYGAISSSLPSLTLPSLNVDRLIQLIHPALVIAMLGGIESLLSAVVADGMTGRRHDSNRELIGQGTANLIAPLFGGIPATGAIARTATNIKNGAASPVSGMVHSLVVLLILVACAPLASSIPLSAMAPILMIVAWNMSERKEFVRLLKLRTNDSLVLAVTFLLTVLVNLTTAVEIGLGLAAVVFLIRMRSALTVTKVLPDPAESKGKVRPYKEEEAGGCPQFGICTIEGPLFFASAGSFERLVEQAAGERAGVLLLRMSRVPFMDATGASKLAEVADRYEASGRTLLLSGLRPQPRAYLDKIGLLGRIGPERLFEHTGEAIAYALARMDRGICAGCRRFAFRECDRLSAMPHEEPASPGT
ncbi:SulP family inorganic anion transporter [Cohnella zeiphila]|uniref:Sulfate permease n=1 Tax=Cohnella zeiphila TaxID=2761120 RepID=A0A7X0SJI3_9BACL|nr:sulfate permease [Cohnella zeiphila]MBB6729944.1 sulfate permease [Cohnella zeiphila]